MLQSMRTCLSLISILLAFCLCPCFAQDAKTSDEVSHCEYSVAMQARGNNVTAICFINIAPDGSLVGTLVNEFGLKVFDFTYSDQRAKVTHVMGPLNKWYIRKVLNKDFSFILSNLNKNENIVEKKRRLTILPNGDMFISNERFKICYTFSKTYIDDETDQ